MIYNLSSDFLWIFVGLPISVLITLLLSATAFIFLPYRLTVQLIARAFRPELGSIDQEPQNAIFAAHTGPVPPVNMIFAQVVNGKVSAEMIRDRFRTRIFTELAEDGTLVYQKLKQVLTSFMGYRFYRLADHFDLNHHVRVCDPTNDLTPAFTGPRFTEEDLKTFIGKLGSRPWKEGRSHWEILIIEHFQSHNSEEEKTLLVLLMDHAYADAYAVDHIFRKLSDNPPTGKKPLLTILPTLPLWSRVVQSIRLPFQMLWDSSWMLTTVQLRKGPWVVSRTDTTGYWNIACTKPIPISKIKGIKNGLGVSYNAVMITALARALHRMCADVEEDFPEVLFCGFPLAKPHHPGTMTNHHYSAPLALPMPDATTINAVRTIDKNFQRIASSSTAPRMLDFWMAISRFIPYALIKIIMSPIAPSMCIGIIPSFAGPHYYAGKFVSDMIATPVPVAAPANNGVEVSIQGTNGHQRICVLMDRNVFPHPDAFGRLEEYLEEEIEILEQFCRGT